MRLRRKLTEVLADYLGKDYVDFQEGERDLFILLKLADQLRLVKVYFPPRRPVIFIVDLGYFTENQIECINALYQGSQVSGKLGQRTSHLILTFEQLLTEETAENLTPGLVQLLEDDLGEMDDMVTEATVMVSRQHDEDEFDDEELDASHSRPPSTLLN
jgi:hypothetical protein